MTPATRSIHSGCEGWIYLDVRTVEEFDQGHAADAYNVPFAFRDPALGMAPNPEFAAVVKRQFTFESRLVLG